MSVMERLRRTRDWAALEIACRLPLRIRYWTVIHEVGYATRNSKNVPATPLYEIMQEMRQPKSMS